MWVPDGWYHVVNRGNRSEHIFRTDDDQRRFLGCLSELPERFGVALHAFVLGDADYANRLLKQAEADVGEQTEARRLAHPGQIGWEQLVDWAEKETGVEWQEALVRHGDWTRDAVVYVAVKRGGWRLSEVVGRIAGLKYPAAGQGMKRIEERRTRDPACDRFIRRLRDQILKLRM